MGRYQLWHTKSGSDKVAWFFLVTKTDLLPHFDFPVPEAIGDALHLNPLLRTMDLSSKTGQGMDKWLNYLRELVAQKKIEKSQT